MDLLASGTVEVTLGLELNEVVSGLSPKRYPKAAEAANEIAALIKRAPTAPPDRDWETDPLFMDLHE